jgi:hypothetical protein
MSNSRLNRVARNEEMCLNNFRPFYCETQMQKPDRQIGLFI